MTPDIELQLKVILKSLTDNVSPAVNPKNQLALEQLNLSLAALEIVIAHLPYVHHFIRQDIVAHIAIAEGLNDILGDTIPTCQLATATSEAREALLDPSRGFSTLQLDARALRDSVSATVREVRDEESDVEIGRMIIKLSEPCLTLGRSWNKPNGFEPRPDQVKDLHELLTKMNGRDVPASIKTDR